MGFLDDTRKVGSRVNDVPILGGFGAWRSLLEERTCQFIVGLGWNDARRRVSAEIEASGGRLVRLIHPSSQISKYASVGSGVVVSAFCRISANATVGRYSLLEAQTIVGADAVLGEAVATGSGVNLTGGSRIGPGTFLGAGATVVGPAQVGAESVIGANGTVLGNIPGRVMAAGTPATVRKRLDAPPGPP